MPCSRKMAIIRWVAMLNSWRPESSLLVEAAQKQAFFKDKAQTLVDVFYNCDLSQEASHVHRVWNDLF